MANLCYIARQMRRSALIAVLACLWPVSVLAGPFGVEIVHVVAPHWPGAPNPMMQDEAESVWGYVEHRFSGDSYGQYDPQGVFYAPFQIDYRPDLTIPARCGGYARAAAQLAIDLYGIPPGPIIAVLNHDCSHAPPSVNLDWTFNADGTVRNRVVMAEKPTELSYVFGLVRTPGFWNPYANFCRGGVCGTRFIDSPDVQGDVFNGKRRWDRQWLTAQEAQFTTGGAGQFTLRTIESPRDGQTKLLFVRRFLNNWALADTNFSVEFRAVRGFYNLPYVMVYRAGTAWDVVDEAIDAQVCEQWPLPVGSTLRIPNTTLGIRVDAIGFTTATVSIVENVITSSVAATRCNKDWLKGDDITTVPPPSGLPPPKGSPPPPSLPK